MSNGDRVIEFFREISKIPRETGKEKEISDYLVSFARDRGLDVRQDELYNVVIKKKSTIESYNGPAVILQGHMDMVYVKTEDSRHVYENGIEIVERDGYLYGNNTTLGADNGIAVAYCLAILDSDAVKHPALEVIITVQEEGGLAGAQFLNVEDIKGRYLINLDAEEEGVVFTSCAGGLRNYVKIPVTKEPVSCETSVIISIDGLKGGHSGLEIDLERGNAIKLLGRLLYGINSDGIYLSSVSSVGKANAIPSKARAVIMTSGDKASGIAQRIEEIEGMLRKELLFSDNINIGVEIKDNHGSSASAYTTDTKNSIINILMLMPCGVINKNMAIPGLVQTSTNMGSLEEDEAFVSILSSVRSSVRSQKYNVADIIRLIAETYGAECEFFNDYPQWEYKQESRLRDLVSSVYEELFMKKPKFTAIHAGLECGYMDEKLEDVDIIAMGPNLYEVHTPDEHVSIESVKNVWIIILRLLERLAE